MTKSTASPSGRRAGLNRYCHATLTASSSIPYPAFLRTRTDLTNPLRSIPSFKRTLPSRPMRRATSGYSGLGLTYASGNSATDSSSTGVKAGGGGAAGKGGGGALAKVRSFVIRVVPTGTATGLSPATTESWVTPKTGFTGSSVVGIGFTSWLDMGGGGLMCSTSLRTTVRGLGSGCGGGSSGGGGSAGLGGTTSTSTVDGRSLRRPCWGTSTSPKATSACSAMATVAPHRGACACLPTDEALFVNRTLLAN